MEKEWLERFIKKKKKSRIENVIKRKGDRLYV